MRCVRMGSRAADESAATEGARPDDGGQDDSGSEVDAWASSEDEEGLDSGAWEGPHTAHDGNRRAASGARCVGAQAARSGARSADHASLHQYHRTPQPARVTVSVRRSRPPTGHRRAAGGDATTTAPPLPDRRATRGVSSRCDPQQCSRRSPQISAGEDPKRRLFTFAFSETLRAPLPRPLAVVKWYRINA